jgi:hypothetical protein
MHIEKKPAIFTGLGILLLVCIAVLAWIPLSLPQELKGEAPKLFLTDKDASQHTVILKESGFEPNTLVIRQNDTVIFKTELGKPFWPASNLHPKHGIYPEFDPKEPVPADGSWEFKFEKAGRFKYHDHVFANYTGLIIALTPQEEEAGVSSAPTTDINECAKHEDVGEKQQCWDEQLEVVLAADGIDMAFDYFLKLYNTEPDVPKECHGWGHTLGEAAYDIYKEGHELNLRPESSYCGYGYFHGFIGALIKDTGQVQNTKEFCLYVEKELEGKVKGVLDNCIHGVGHGVTSMLLEEGGDHIGDFMKTGKKGVDICEMIYTEAMDLENCYDGVFNELHLELFNSNYGMDFAKYMEESNNDPFHYCKLQEDRHKLACFYELSGMFWFIFDLDVVAATQYALENTEDLHTRGEKVVAKIAADQIQFDIVKDTHEKSIDACRIVPDFLFKACFEGIINGFVQHGEPGNYHVKGYAFCDEAYLTKEESVQCYEGLTRMLEWLYNPEDFKRACDYIEYDPRAQQCQTLRSAA